MCCLPQSLRYCYHNRYLTTRLFPGVIALEHELSRHRAEADNGSLIEAGSVHVLGRYRVVDDKSYLVLNRDDNWPKDFAALRIDEKTCIMSLAPVRYSDFQLEQFLNLTHHDSILLINDNVDIQYTNESPDTEKKAADKTCSVT